MVIGNFKRAGGVAHDQVVRIDLGTATATIANWNTDRYAARCYATGFDSYVRDVAYSPDGTFFVLVTTGAAYAGALCDTAARWESSATGAAQQPTWIAHSGGDTFLSVAISEQVVYVGGHFRWLNNDLATDTARAGAVARPSIAALEPASGVPTAWNPGRHPRGYGTTEMYVTPQGLWIGYDQEWIGAIAYKRDRIAFFPLTGGAPTHSTATRALPGKVYTLGQNPPNTVLYRVNAGGRPCLPGRGLGRRLQRHAVHPATSPATYPPSGRRRRRCPPDHRRHHSSPASGTAWPRPRPELVLPGRHGHGAPGTAVLLQPVHLPPVGDRQFNVNVDDVPKVTDFDCHRVGQRGRHDEVVPHHQ